MNVDEFKKMLDDTVEMAQHKKQGMFIIYEPRDAFFLPTFSIVSLRKDIKPLFYVTQEGNIIHMSAIKK